MLRSIVVGLCAILMLIKSIEGCSCGIWCQTNGYPYGICGDGPTCICSKEPITNPGIISDKDYDSSDCGIPRCDVSEVGCGCGGWCRQNGNPYGICSDGHSCRCQTTPITDSENSCECAAKCRKGGKPYGVCGDGYSCICSTEPITNPERGCGCASWCRQQGHPGGICGDGHSCICDPKVNTDTKSYVQGAYKLTINNDVGHEFTNAMRQSVIDSYFQIYPIISTRFNAGGTKAVSVTIDPKYDGVAAAASNRITISFNFLKQFPNARGVMTHELMHVVQSYPGGQPGWLVEGIADYVRWKYADDKEGWGLANFSLNQHYTQSYTITARFLVWLERRVKNNIVDLLDRALRQNQYDDGRSWIQISGKTVDQLWNDYTNNPQL